ncbi:MAG TPA: hypothetical protein PKA17_07085, partial [Phenylobacterium sp.]|nr:hypothetical protein [Phenylobacterium sp.]
MARPAAYGRLFTAAWILARHDALLPAELEAQYPPPIRDLGRVVRRLGGKQARSGRPGERLARALVELIERDQQDVIAAAIEALAGLSEELRAIGPGKAALNGYRAP